MNRRKKQAHPLTVEWSTNCASGGHADAVRWAATLPTGGDPTWRRPCNAQRLSLRGRSPSPLWWGMQVGETGFESGVDAQRHKSPAYGGTDHGALARLTASC